MEVADNPSPPVVNPNPAQSEKKSTRRPPNRPRNNPSGQNAGGDGATEQSPNHTRGNRLPGGDEKRARRPARPNRAPRGAGITPSESKEHDIRSAPNPDNASGPSAPPLPRKPKRRNPAKAPDTAPPNDVSTATTASSTVAAGPEGGSLNAPKGRKPIRNRGARFNAGLTEPSRDPSSADTKPANRYRASVPEQDDLTSTLIRNLRTPPYPDCAICFSAIRPEHHTWSCSPFTPIHTGSNDDKDGPPNPRENENSQYCWTTFHVKCIRPWAEKSVKEVADAWRARGEERRGEWRCPGCQVKREIVPHGYWCFCGSTPEPKPPRLATPHSCANSCSRPRVCGHPCPLECHPGPCPPCQVTTQLPCHCSRQILSFRCSHLAPGRLGVLATDTSCGNVCGRKLGCGNHTCEQLCHPGACKPCEVKTSARCYCGKVDREVGCGEGEEKTCVVEDIDGQSGDKWIGRFTCENICQRPFDCGEHFCSKPCHPPSSTPPPCPRSPSLVTHCPCGKHELSPSSASSFPSGKVLSRTKCSDPIPTCTSICMKPLASCTHVCSTKCHTGPCPPCSIMLVRPCRCGATTKDVKCSSIQAAGAQDEILCDKSCTALRACGRHQCNRVCCPLASLAGVSKGKGKKKAGAPVPGLLDGIGTDKGGLHECDLVCGKVLSCGNHQCEERDHRGHCPPCLRSSFEEMICYCGRTVLDPPIPCGTRINCTYLCTRPPPPCGHPRTTHSCHEDPTPCPPCPFLASKMCACGKKMVGNVRCSQERVSCGATCGKLMACGFHHCERLCHGDDCGPCTAPCGKSRKLCHPAHHPCTQPCHAPSACPEVDPCQAIIILTCPCGRIRQSVHCGRSASSPSGRETSQQPKCSNECNIAKRNARLADALGINPENREKAVTYNDDVVSFAKANSKFLGLVEKAFSDFLGSEKKTQVLPHMPPERRKFVHDLAIVYRMDTQMVDQEPHRSVQLLRRLDSRIPTPLLSNHISPPAPPSLGKLADLRSSSAQSWRSQAPIAPVPSRPSTTVSQRGWTSVVARSANSTPNLAGAGANPRALASASASASANPSPSPRPIASNTAGHGRPGPSAGTASPAPVVTATDAPVPDNWEDDL